MYLCIKQQLNGFPSEKEMQNIAEKLRTAPFFVTLSPKMQTGRRSHTNKNKLCTATHTIHHYALCWHLAFTRNGWREITGCLATKQMEKGSG